MTELQENPSPGLVRFSLRGEVDLATAEVIDSAARDALADGATVLHLDLSEVTFMDSQGISALLAAHRALIRAGASLVLVGVPPRVRRVFEVTGLEQVLAFDETPPPA